jgi:hypothetical protein
MKQFGVDKSSLVRPALPSATAIGQTSKREDLPRQRVHNFELVACRRKTFRAQQITSKFKEYTKT